MDSTLQQVLIVASLTSFGLICFFIGYLLGKRNEKIVCKREIEKMKDEFAQRHVRVQEEELNLVNKKQEIFEREQEVVQKPKFKQEEKSIIEEEFGFKL